MADVNNVTDDYLATTTDGFHETSALAYQMDMIENITADGHWLHFNTTDVYQFFQNATSGDNTIDDEINGDKHSALVFTLLIFKWTLCPFILIGNILTIIVVGKYIKKITPTHVVIAFLSVAGFFVGLVDLLGFIIYLMNGDPVHSNYIYDLMFWIALLTTGLNMSAIFLIAFERCCLTTLWGLHQKHLTVRRQVGLCVAFSVYFLGFATVLTLMADIESRYGVLILKFKQKNIVYAIFIPTYALITCALAFCYLRICIFLWKHRKALVSSKSSSNQKNFQKEKKTTVIIAIILTVYLTGTLPNFLYFLMAGNNSKFPKLDLQEFFRFLWCATSLADIAVYAWKVPEFQEGYCKILCCLRKVRTIQVAPRSNVQPSVMNFPLEPRREV